MTFSLLDLLGLPDPISEALEKYELIGRGSMAYVFAHPDDPSLAIRLNEDPDAWYLYAMRLAEVEANLVEAHGPQIVEMLCHNGYYAAVVERLEPLDDETWVECAVELSHGIQAGDRHAKFLKANPLFLRYLDECPVRVTDTRSENWMLRNGMIIVNDPSGRMMSSSELDEFSQAYGLGACYSPR